MSHNALQNRMNGSNRINGNGFHGPADTFINPPANTPAPAAGNRLNVTLPDGTVVDLSGDSHMLLAALATLRGGAAVAPVQKGPATAPAAPAVPATPVARPKSESRRRPDEALFTWDKFPGEEFTYAEIAEIDGCSRNAVNIAVLRRGGQFRGGLIRRVGGPEPRPAGGRLAGRAKPMFTCDEHPEAGEMTIERAAELADRKPAAVLSAVYQKDRSGRCGGLMFRRVNTSPAAPSPTAARRREPATPSPSPEEE